MIVKHVDDLNGTDRDVTADTWRSRRLLLASDGRGYSLHETILSAGTETSMHYVHHVESVYCTSGEGTLFDDENGTSYELRPGTLYVLDGHESHRVVARTDIRCVCVFTPPVTGREVHDENGVYPLIKENSQ